MNKMVLGIKVYDAMSTNVKYISPGSTVHNAVQHMIKEGIGSLICCEDDKIKGIITERDIIKKVVALDRDPKKVFVSDIMTKRVVYVNPNEDLEKATKIMAKKRIRRLPVINKKKVVGMLTVKDILKIEPLLIEILVEKLNIKSKRFYRSERIEGFCDNCKKHTRNLQFVEGNLFCENCR